MGINFTACKNSTAVKALARSTAFADLVSAFTAIYGAENVSVVGNSEIAVCVGTAPLPDGTEGEVCFTVKPVVKEYADKVTASGKAVKAYERLTEADAYEVEKSAKEAEAEAKAKAKAKKIAADKANRQG